jgi:hypothetical protein
MEIRTLRGTTLELLADLLASYFIDLMSVCELKFKISKRLARVAIDNVINTH